MNKLTFLLFIVFCTGCAFFSNTNKGKYGKNIANLDKIAALPTLEELEPVPLIPLDDIEASYRSALDFAEDSDIKHKILIRLADLEMAKSEERQYVSQEPGKFFTEAIRLYEELIILNKEFEHEEATPTNERILYQLSKAHALDGEIEKSNEALARLVEKHPESDFLAEAEFRRAELAFRKKDYREAELRYNNVIQIGDQTPFYRNAIYMHGWSQFKRTKYLASVNSFTQVLDLVLVEGKTDEQLSNSERNITQDVFRIMAIVFSYLEGAKTINEVYAELGDRHYQHKLYQNLGDLYLEKKRYRDSADTYRAYMQKYPLSDYAPLFSVKAIEVYELGDFPSEIRPAKEEYVANYGITSEYWAQRSQEQHKALTPYLRLYIDELAAFYHSKAQQLVDAQSLYDQLSVSGTSAQKRKLVQPDDAIPAYLKAAGFYREFLNTFPKDEKEASMTYLMGDAYFEAAYYIEALDAYEVVAYQLLDKEYGSRAGFSAIAALTALIDQTADPERATWLNKRVDFSVTFADYYPAHPEVLPVYTQATQDVFSQNNFERSVTMAERIIAWQPAAEVTYLKTAWLVSAHSLFELTRYDESEIAYRNVLALIPETDPEHTQMKERIAASIFKSAEQLVAGDNKMGAVNRLLSIQDIAPDSEIAVSAQYDASSYLIELKEWSDAEQVLLFFAQRYPQNPLSNTIPKKLAFVYQESEQWGKAANILAAMGSDESDPDLRRQSRYLSAELYEKSGDLKNAILQYRDYANNYPAPFGLATEARFKLVELYGQNKQTDKRRFWLQKLIDENKKAGSNSTQRSIFLAAMAEAEFAEDTFVAYEKIKLTQPLKKSLKKKRIALKKSLDAYKRVNDYGVAKFATLSNYKIAQLYAQLSKDLLNSQRPKGLNELALEEYGYLMEDQAFPFEEKAIEIHTQNSKRAWQGIYDEWVKQSFDSLANLVPARYGKKEIKLETSNGLF